jgi:putative NADPH-quinone reductase
MNILLVLAHPEAASFNHALAQAARDALRALGHDVAYHDLYAEGFDPVLTGREIPRTGPLPPVVARHCLELQAAEGLVLVHPNWWGKPPAILAGWVDRVFRVDVAYRFLEGDQGEGVPEGLLKCRQALVLNTSNTALARERAVFGDPLQKIWCDCILKFCGIGKVRRRMFETVVTSTLAQRQAWLEEARHLIAEMFPQNI